MRRAAMFLLSISLLGCPKQGATNAALSHPDLVCAEGSEPTGAVPPTGLEAWCRKVTPQGDWSKEGTYLAWHENHEKKAQGQYVSDKRQGPWTYWYPTGQVEKQGSYTGGVEDGFWVSFHAEGQRASEGKMVDGKEHGPWVYWAENGERTEGTWQLGLREGTWTVYGPDDVPRSEFQYRAGRLITKREL